MTDNQGMLTPDEPDTSSDATASQSRKTPIIIGAIVAVLIVIAAIAGYQLLNNTDTASGNGDQSNSANAPGYVDDSGRQNNLPAPAPGANSEVKEMSMRIGDRTAPVDLIQATDNNSLLPPQDVKRVGWYSASAIPGVNGAGSSLITGHINDATQGDGYAHQFTSLKEGDKVIVTVNGEDRSFTVNAEPYHVPKGTQFPDIVNQAEGDNQLVLITCGGQFVGGLLGYADNIIVTAVPDNPIG